ncbi:putative PAS/PAC sensor protein [Minicystis rosea]|nr:putative PAS/PAC sensor protein [Minicystis rosea]
MHDGRVVVDANQAMSSAFGYAPSELRGLRVDAFLEVAPGNDLAAYLESNDERLFEATARRKGNGTFLADVVSKPVSATGLHGLTIRDVTAHRAIAQAFHDSEERFRLISELSSEGLVLTERGVIFHANDAMTAIFGYSREELMGMRASDLTAAEDQEIAIAHIRSGSEEPYEATGIRKDGSKFVGSITGTNVPYQGRMVRGSRIRDVSAQRQADEARRQNIIHEEKIRTQAERLAEMSTPLISISDDVIAMPLIGTMDMARARQALRTLLDGIARKDAHTAIIDITGISGIDTGVASSLVRMARAARLQGTEVVLTGISPQVADTLVMLDVELSGIVLKASFQDGIRYGMKRGRHALLDLDLELDLD